MHRAFLICPVRGHDPQEYAELVATLEGRGWQIHYPPRDTDQEDDTGYRVCADNRTAIEAAERVFVVWSGESQGVLFDMGMAFALRKPITIIGPLPRRTRGKSFLNMLREWAKGINPCAS
ncbi:MAG: nucleoside 2-deoxyribosyltransferase [Anaerovoracaceae bacterium]|jgi:hypothetical protein